MRAKLKEHCKLQYNRDGLDMLIAYLCLFLSRDMSLFKESLYAGSSTQTTHSVKKNAWETTSLLIDHVNQ